MADIKSVNVGGVTYNVAHASAVDQKTLMHHIGTITAMHSARGQVETIDSNMLIGVLLAIPEATFDAVAGIALCKTVKHGSSETVDISQFQGDMLNYHKLVAEAVKVNLSDFFTYLDDVNRSVRQQSARPQ